MTSQADCALEVVADQEVACLGVKVLHVRVMTACAFDVSANQLYRRVFGPPLSCKRRHQVCDVFQRKLQAEWMGALQVRTQHIGNRPRHLKRPDPDRLAYGDRTIMAAKAHGTARAFLRLHACILIGATGVKRVRLIRESLVPQPFARAGMRHVAVDAGIRVRTLNAGRAAHIVGAQHVLGGWILC